MRITQKDFVALAKAICMPGEKRLKLTRGLEEDYLVWGEGLVKSPGEFPDTVEVPPRFLGVWRQFSQSSDYDPDLDALVLAAEQLANPAPYKPLETNAQSSSMNSPSFLQQFTRLTGETKSAFECIELGRRGGNETELDRAVRRAVQALARERRDSFGDPVEKILADPQQRLFWNAVGRRFSGGPMSEGECEVFEKYSRQFVTKDFSAGLTPGVAPGSVLYPLPVSPDVWDLLLNYGAFRDLGVRPMASPYNRFAQVTGLPDAAFITPAHQGPVAYTADASFAGTSIVETANTVAARVEISQEWIQDAQLDVASAVLTRLSMGLAKRIDWACFQGTGADDQINGSQTGMFVDAGIQTYVSAAGQGGYPSREDFLGVIASVAPAALQRADNCRWFISPALIPRLMQLKDGQGPQYLLKTPAETQGEWHLVGFPVTWAAQAPGVNEAGAKIAAFGERNSYLVALRQMFELSASDWSDARFVRQVRALMRGFCQTRDATGLATLTLGQP